MFEVKDFSKDVIEASFKRPVLVDFWAEWCEPCQFIGPIIEKLASEANNKWKLVMVNTEINQELANEWGVRGVPNMKLFYKGEIIDEVSGAMVEADIRMWLADKLPSKATVLEIEGAQLIEQGKIEEGVKKLEDALNVDANLEKAKILLARQLLWVSPEQAIFLLKDIAYLEEAKEAMLIAETMLSCEDDFAESRAKAELIEGIDAMKKQDFSRSLEKLIKAIMIDKRYLDEMARRLAIAVFHYLGEAHEITRKYRRQFDMALY